MLVKEKILQKEHSKLSSMSPILRADKQIMRSGKDKRGETVFYTLCLKIYNPYRNEETKPVFISSSRRQPE